MDRERQKIYCDEVLPFVKENVGRLPDGSEFALVSIFDDKIIGLIFDKDEIDGKELVSRDIEIQP